MNGAARGRAKRSLGQIFLVDPNLQRKIVEALGAGPEDEVLEIGPGHGELTQHLAGRVRRLVAVELDDELARALGERYGGREDVVIVHGDILEIPLAEVTARPERLKVLGNIPYNRTSPILFRLLERPRPTEILVMVQREVGHRILSAPGQRSYGALTVGVRSVARVERVIHVPRGAFRPVPHVDSTVLRIRPYQPPPLSPLEERDLRKLTRTLFQQRRKQLQKILRSSDEYRLDGDAIEALARETGFDPSARPEQLSPEALAQLARAIARRRAARGPKGCAG